MSESKAIKLPSASEIMERLSRVDNDPFMTNRFYSSIASEAGRKLVARELVKMLTQKIQDFASSVSSGSYSLVLVYLLLMKVPSYIDALVDDQEVADEAKRFHQEVMDAVR
jgi:hypothetical protein